MIDTIRVKTHIRTFSRKKCENLNKFVNGHLLFEFFNIPVQKESWYPFIYTSIKKDKFDREERFLLTLECSIPKQIYGNNIQISTFDDITPVLESIKLFLEENGVVFIDSVSDWLVSRIDICNYIYTEDKIGMIERLQQSTFPRKTSIAYDTTGAYFGKDKRRYIIKYYDKLVEFREHDRQRIEQHSINESLVLQDAVKNYIRYEVGYKREFLYRYLKLKNKRVMVKDILKYKDKLIDHFFMINKKLYADIPIENISDKSVLDVFIKELGIVKGHKLFNFYKAYFKSAQSRRLAKQNDYSETTWYKNRKLMEQLIKKIKVCNPLCFGKPSQASEQSFVNPIDEYMNNKV